MQGWQGPDRSCTCKHAPWQVPYNVPMHHPRTLSIWSYASAVEPPVSASTCKETVNRETVHPPVKWAAHTNTPSVQS